jgi:hypothetical protein
MYLAFALFSPLLFRAAREAKFLPALVLAAPLPRGPRALWWEGGLRFQRSAVYSCSLGADFVARFSGAHRCTPVTSTTPPNKRPPDPLPMQLFPLMSELDLGGMVCPGGGVDVAAALPLWSFVLPIPSLFRRCSLWRWQGRWGRLVQEWRLPVTATSAGGRAAQHREQGQRQAELLLLPRGFRLVEAVVLRSSSAPGFFPADVPQRGGLGRRQRRATYSVQKACDAMMCSWIQVRGSSVSSSSGGCFGNRRRRTAGDSLVQLRKSMGQFVIFCFLGFPLLLCWATCPFWFCLEVSRSRVCVSCVRLYTLCN